MRPASWTPALRGIDPRFLKMIWAEEERKLQEERAIMLQEHDNPIEPHMVER